MFLLLMQSLTVKHTSFGDVPHSSGLHDVPDDKLLDGLVLGNTAGTVGAADGLDMATAFLCTSVVPSLLSLSLRNLNTSIIKIVLDKIQLNILYFLTNEFP